MQIRIRNTDIYIQMGISVALYDCSVLVGDHGCGEVLPDQHGGGAV
jgi:hypothetical protein